MRGEKFRRSSRKFAVFTIALLTAWNMSALSSVYAETTIVSGKNTVIQSDMYANPSDEDGNYDENGKVYYSEIPPATAYISLIDPNTGKQIQPHYTDMQGKSLDDSTLDVTDEDGNYLGKMHFLTTSAELGSVFEDPDTGKSFKHGTGWNTYVYYIGDMPANTYANGVNTPGRTSPIQYKTVYKNCVTLADGTKADLTVVRSTTLNNFSEAQKSGGWVLIGDSDTSDALDDGTINNCTLLMSNADGTKWEGQNGLGNLTQMDFKVTRDGETLDESTQLCVTDLDTAGVDTTLDPGYVRQWGDSQPANNFTYYDADGNKTKAINSVRRERMVAVTGQVMRGSYPSLSDNYTYVPTDLKSDPITAGKGSVEPTSSDDSFSGGAIPPDRYYRKVIQTRPESYIGTPWVGGATPTEDITITYENTAMHKYNYSSTADFYESVVLGDGIITPIYIPKDYLLWTDGIKASGGTEFASAVNTQTTGDPNAPSGDYWESKSSFTVGLSTKDFSFDWKGFSCGTGYAFGAQNHMIRATTSGLYPNGGSISTKLLNPELDPMMEDVSTGPENNRGKTNQTFNALTRGQEQTFTIKPNEGYVVDKFYVEKLVEGVWTKMEVKPGDDTEEYAYKEIKKDGKPTGEYQFTIKDANNNFHMDATFAKKPELAIEKVADVEAAAKGDIITYNIKVTNKNDGDAKDTTVTDTLPDGLEFVEASASGQYDEETREIKWTSQTVKGVTHSGNVNRTEDGTTPSAQELLGDEYDYHDDYAQADDVVTPGEPTVLTVKAKVIDDSYAGVTNTATAEDPEMQNEEPPTDDAKLPFIQKETVNRTIHYNYNSKDGDKAADDYTDQLDFERTGVYNETTKQYEYPAWEPKSFEDIDSPDKTDEGWSPDRPIVTGTSVTPDDADVVEQVIYTPKPPVSENDETWGGKNQPQTGTPVFNVETTTTPDGSDNEIETYKLIDPKTGEPTDETTITTDEGTYTLNEDHTVTFQPKNGFTGDPTPIKIEGTDKNGEKVTATYTPHVVDNEESKTVTRTIEYKYLTPDGKTAADTVTQTATFNRTAKVNPDNGELTWPSWDEACPPQEFSEVTSPSFEGWTADKSSVPEAIIYPTDEDMKEVVVYTPEPPVATSATSEDYKDKKQTGTPEFRVTTPNTPDGTENKIEKIELLDKDGKPADKVTVPEGTYTITDGKITFTPKKGYVGEVTPVDVRGTDSNGMTIVTTYTPNVIDTPKVEPKPKKKDTNPPKKKTTGGKKTSGGTYVYTVNTGDQNDIGSYAIMMMVAAGALIAMGLVRRKIRK